VYSKEQLKKPRKVHLEQLKESKKKDLEFNEKEYDEIDDYCKEKKIIWFSSAWDINSLKFLDKYDLKYNKIASAMILDKLF
jgi:N-acetylneuraminate synthase